MIGGGSECQWFKPAFAAVKQMTVRDINGSAGLLLTMPLKAVALQPVYLLMNR